MQPKVSIVTITYNAEKYLERTIKSVIDQSYDHIEYIIIDGASKDGTLDLVKKYRDHIHYFISEPDNGVFDAMNKGIKAATGAWVNFLNAGDTYLQDDVIEQIPFMKHRNDALLYGNRVIDMERLTFPYPQESIKLGMIPACHQAMFFNKAFLKNEFYHDTTYRLFSEYAMIADFYTKGYSMKYVDINMVNYLSEGISNEISWHARKAKFYYLYKYFGLGGVLRGVANKLGILKLPQPIRKTVKYDQ